eukprot:6467621-Amphidinium_carterae.1
MAGNFFRGTSVDQVSCANPDTKLLKKLEKEGGFPKHFKEKVDMKKVRYRSSGDNNMTSHQKETTTPDGRITRLNGHKGISATLEVLKAQSDIIYYQERDIVQIDSLTSRARSFFSPNDYCNVVLQFQMFVCVLQVKQQKGLITRRHIPHS